MPELAHIVGPDGRPICPEAEYRDSLDDGAFWAHVFGQDGPEQPYDPDDDPNVPDLDELALEDHLATPCPECGQTGACAYDAEGRALIHAVSSEEDEEA